MQASPKAVIFDWDGTLVNTIPLLFRSHNHVRKILNVPLWSMAEYRQVIHRSTRDVYPELYGPDSQRAIDLLYSFYNDNHLAHLELFTGAREVIEFLASSTMPIAVVSNKKQQYLEREIEHLGWQGYFQETIGAGTAERDKPHADPLLLALVRMGLAPSEQDILYVGDTRTDLETSANAGCGSVLILNNENKDHLVEAFRPNYVFNDCFGLQNALNIVIQQVNKISAG